MNFFDDHLTSDPNGENGKVKKIEDKMKVYTSHMGIKTFFSPSYGHLSLIFSDIF